MITIRWTSDDGTEFAAVDIPISNAQRNALLDWWRAQPGNLKPPIDAETAPEQYGRQSAARRLSRQMVRRLFDAHHLARRLFDAHHESRIAEMVDAAVMEARAQALTAAGLPVGIPEESDA